MVGCSPALATCWSSQILNIEMLLCNILVNKLILSKLLYLQINLTVDWNGSPENYTCFEKTFFDPDPSVPAFITQDYIPPAYSVS